MSIKTQSERDSSLLKEWRYLEERPHPWRKSLTLKDRKLRAYNVWTDMQAEGMTPEEAARNWDLPLEAIEEVVRYVEAHQVLLRWEADEERRRLMEKGVPLEPPPAAG